MYKIRVVHVVAGWLMVPVLWFLFPFLVLALCIWVQLDRPRKP